MKYFIRDAARDDILRQYRYFLLNAKVLRQRSGSSHLFKKRSDKSAKVPVSALLASSAILN
jgi:hypothetical protein